MELIEPAVRGTLNVLRSCTKAQSVKRVVLTSSMATVMSKRFTQTTNILIDETWFSDPLFGQETQVNCYLIFFNCFNLIIIIVAVLYRLHVTCMFIFYVGTHVHCNYTSKLEYIYFKLANEFLFGEK